MSEEIQPDSKSSPSMQLPETIEQLDNSVEMIIHQAQSDNEEVKLQT